MHKPVVDEVVVVVVVAAASVDEEEAVAVEAVVEVVVEDKVDGEVREWQGPFSFEEVVEEEEPLERPLSGQRVAVPQE